MNFPPLFQVTGSAKIEDEILKFVQFVNLEKLKLNSMKNLTACCEGEEEAGGSGGVSLFIEEPVDPKRVSSSAFSSLLTSSSNLYGSPTNMGLGFFCSGCSGNKVSLGLRFKGSFSLPPLMPRNALSRGPKLGEEDIFLGKVE